ncbi:MAG TPA: sugar transferase [Anaerolineales bacterium]|nr:sugar transferase [Anaerolineales bacterium]
MRAGAFPAGIPFSKRLLDYLLTLTGLFILSPILLMLAVLVRVFLGSPVFFLQQRPGYRGRPFTLIKFRTMRDDRYPDGRPMPDEVRLTGFGRFLRSTSLDELPELFNVLRGEMSLIGPRPLLMRYLDRYTPQQARRHEVLPGITGWAQVNGRNNVSWEEKFRLDVWYVDNWSFGLDLQILARTVWKVIAREGISEPGNATAREFMGEGDQRTK